MFLAGKVEETPRPLKDVILVSYEIIHKKDPAAIQRIKQKEVYEQQKELILLGERVVLATLGFDLNVVHPYKPLVEAIKKFKVAQNAVAQVAWNFVNDGLRTSLCLQFKPHHIAAGAIFLAAKFLKVKLPSDGDKVWWQEFDVTPRQLEEVSNQMLELYEQNKVPPSQFNEAEGIAGGSQQPSSKPPAANEDNATSYTHPQGSRASRAASSKQTSSRPIADQSYDEKNVGLARTAQSQNNDSRNSETSGLSEQHENDDINGSKHQKPEQFPLQGTREVHSTSRLVSEAYGEEELEKSDARIGTGDYRDLSDRYHSRVSENKDVIFSQSPQDAIKRIDKDKVKAALEKRRKLRTHVSKKTDSMDEDLIERVLEDGIELADENENSNREMKQHLSDFSSRSERENHFKHDGEATDGH